MSTVPSDAWGRRIPSGVRHVPQPSASADADVEAFLVEVDRGLRSHFQDALARVARISPLKPGVAHQLASGGKRVRAALCVASCELFGTPYVKGLHFAAAIEHIHNFTLVHDDIADGDVQRRQHPSMWKQHGIAHAINIGDAFVALAAQSILAAPYADALKLRLLATSADYALEMAEGQNLDLDLQHNDDAVVDDYVECMTKKTGAFLAMAAVGGGLIGGGGDGDLKRLQAFARLGGVAFQIRDDLLDMEHAKGRERGSDILEGKRTLMVIRAAHRASATERRRLRTILKKPRESTSGADVEWVWQLFRRTEADVDAARIAEDFVDQACEHVLDLPESPAKYRLLRLARYLGARRH